MDWYCALTEHLLRDVTMNKSLERPLELVRQRVIGLYKAILRYQMNSVRSYNDPQVFVFLRSLANGKYWDDELDKVKDAETTLLNDWKTYDGVEAKELSRKLVELAKDVEEQLGVIHQDLREFIDQQQKIQADSENKECIWDLRVVNPQDDVKRIEDEKEELFDDAYKWMLEDDKYAAFTNWDESNRLPCRLLWIKGPAGTGKTMLLIGIIRELSDQPAVLAPTLSYFFCQGQGKTDSPLNDATAALRSLIWMLVIQQPHLISHLQADYKHSRGAFFTDKNAFVALSRVVQNMLKDARPVYFIVDALDECDQGLQGLINLISTSLTLSDKVRWLVSSRPDVDVLSKLKNLDISRIVDLNAHGLDGPVNAYIMHKLSALEKHGKGYTNSILADVSDQVRQRAESTFLWVALVFKSLEKVHGEYALKTIKDMPRGLPKLYDHMMTRIEKVEMVDPQDCKRVLVATSLAYRPLTLTEIAALTGLSLGITQTAVDECGSFLTTKRETVSLIHQSAKDYVENDLKGLDKNHKSRLQLGGLTQGHADITRRSVDRMSTLRRDIYDLRQYGIQSKDITPPVEDPLAPIRYPCVFWLDHLRDAIKESPGNSKELCDLGFKFLEEHFLHWLESLSLLHRLSAGIISIRELLIVVQVCL